MTGAAVALTLMAQQVTQAQLTDPGPGRMSVLDPQGIGAANFVESDDRRAIAMFARCIADATPGRASELLSEDFTDQVYEEDLAGLFRNNSACERKARRSRAYASRLLLVGGLAESLMKASSNSVAKELVLANSRPPVRSYGPSDAVAICVVRSEPEAVAGLFASDLATPDEADAVKALRAPVGRCSKRSFKVSDGALRAMLALAAFRSVAAKAADDLRATKQVAPK